MNNKINLYNTASDIHTDQSIYDNFNGFIFSKDRNVFNKLVSKIMFYDMTKHLVGDIIECGVFKGSGILSWLKLIDMNEPHSIKKVIGLDFFDPSFVEDIKNEVDRETMRQVFTRDKELNLNDVSYDGITAKIKNAGIENSKFELVKGDVIETSRELVKMRPGLRISILYLDLDLYEPTIAALENFWDRVVPGGIVVFDEHAYHSWSEAQAVDEFVTKYNLKGALRSTNIKAPTAFIVKPLV